MARRQPPVKLQTFPDLVEEALDALLEVLDAPCQYWTEAGHHWRSRVRVARDRAAELRPWIEAERQRNA